MYGVMLEFSGSKKCMENKVFSDVSVSLITVTFGLTTMQKKQHDNAP